jgi:WD40 repeat protein
LCLETFEGHTSLVIGAMELADGRLLSWSYDGTLRIWHSQNGLCLATLEGHKDNVIDSLELADGRLLSWSGDKTLRLWDSRSGACLATLEGHKDWIVGALELNDGRLLSWSEYDHTLRLWDSQRGECLLVEPIQGGIRYHRELRLAMVKKTIPDCVIGEYYITPSNENRSTELYQRTLPSSLANWNSEVSLQTRNLFLDGTVIVTLDSGQVCFLNLYHGNRRISLVELEAFT